MLKKLSFMGFATLLVALVFSANVHASSLATITPGNMQGWFFYNDETDVVDNSLGSFVTGPATTPAGTGSVQISVTGTQRRNLATYQFSATPLTSITDLRYSTYNPLLGNGAGVGSTRSGYLQFNVDFNGSDTWQSRLVYLPSDNGAVVQDTWQEWNAINSGNALWRYSGATWPAPNAIPGTTPKTWSQILADYPGVKVRTTDAFMGIRVGEPYADGYTENIDKFVFSTASTSTVFDFEVTDTTAPMAPTPLYPSNGAVKTTAMQDKVDWTDVTDSSSPVSYVYQASNASSTNPDGSFVSPVYTSGPLAVSEIPTPGTAEGTYYWHVQAVDSAGNTSPWSTVWSFTVDNTLPGTLSAEDFGVMIASGVKGYTAGFGLTDATFAGATSVVMELYSGTTLLQTNTGTALIGSTILGNQISSPFDVFGTFDYTADGYWTNVRGSEYGQNLIPTRVVATVTLENGKVVTAENTNLTGDPSTIFPVTPPTTSPTDKNQCKDGGWKTFSNPSFKNQGQCVSSVVSHR